MIKRYTRGLPFGIGAMEQCDDGEWVKHNDMSRVVDNLHDKIRLLKADNLRLNSKLRHHKHDTFLILLYTAFVMLIGTAIGLFLK